MVKIPGVDPLSEGTIHRKWRKSSTEEVVTGAPSTVSVPPADDVVVIEGQEVQTQTEKAAVTPGSAPAPAEKRQQQHFHIYRYKTENSCSEAKNSCSAEAKGRLRCHIHERKPVCVWLSSGRWTCTACPYKKPTPPRILQMLGAVKVHHYREGEALPL